jgi:hypothetical protein
MYTNDVDEAEVAKYRLPPCYEYMEQASIMQVMTIRLGVLILGPQLTRSMAEYFQFKKSSLNILSEEQIRQHLRKHRPITVQTPTPRRREISNSPEIEYIDLQDILHQIATDEPINLKLKLDTIHAYFQTLCLVRPGFEGFSDEFSILYTEFQNLEAGTQALKGRIKLFCQNYIHSPKPYSSRIIPSPNSAFEQYGAK